jgi:hypothetical protein
MIRNKKMSTMKAFLTQVLTTNILGICALTASISFAAGELYRYEGANGEVVIDDNIPPEFIPKGYSILNKSGLVVERVEPALTEEELADLSDEKREKELKEEQEKQDDWLLQRFSDAGDAVLARDRQLGALDTLIIVAESNINKLKQEETKELEYAAASERAGQEVGEAVLNSLERIRAQIRAAELQIENQKNEQRILNHKYEVMIKRLKEIEKKRNLRNL